MDYWIKLPNNLVWAYEDGEEPLLTKEYNKLLVTMVYLDLHINNANECCFTLEDLIKKSGFLALSGKGRAIEQFKTSLTYLQSLGWLDSTLDIKSLKPKDYVCCKYQVKFIQDDCDNDTYFFRLFYSKYEKIMKNDSKLDKLLTLKIYCYIIARMKRNSAEQQESIDVQYLDGTVVEYMYADYITICSDLGIADNTLTANLELLEQLGLIYYDNIGLVTDEFGGSHSANNVYAETEEYLKRALTCSREYYVGKGYKITGKKCSKKTNIKKGYKGQIKKQTNQGKDVSELEDILEDLNSEDINENKKHTGIKKKSQDSNWGTNAFDNKKVINF